MFELLSNVQSVPIDPDSLIMVHSGMNKVRVSVSDHVSEPSDVYIITGQSNGNLESYIIFYILEPGIHVVYGWDQNPYAPAVKEQVLEEAINFVEAMGSILEQIPWETMTLDQRSAWIDKEILYATTVVEGLEEVEEIEAIQIVEIEDETTEEGELEENPDLDPDEDVVEVSEEEVQEVISESGFVKGFPESEKAVEKSIGVGLKPENIDEKDVDGADTGGMKDVVVGEEDFDELLKQAFLKPDIAEKTKLKKGKLKAARVEEEAELSRELESIEVAEEMEISGSPEGAVKVENGPFPEEKSADAVEASPLPNNSTMSEKDTRFKVIKFLSRF